MIEELKKIAIEAGEIFKEGYHAPKDITFKSSIDLVTQYDLKIELFLKERLKVSFPDYTLVGEETSETISFPKKAIYIDPIDGTTNFIHGIPFCAISIGLWEDNQPIAGVVYNPILDEIYSAEKGKGAFLNSNLLKVSQTNILQQSLVATGFPYTKVDKGRDYEWVLECMQAVLPYTRDIRRLGSAALDLCFLARGNFDIYYEVNLKPWDVAAGILILQEAGGKISNDVNRPYRLEDRVIVATNGLVHDAFGKIVPKL